ncbi:MULTISPECIES: type VI secretion system ATPase TssH [Marinomonas]|uniref:Type VI secretion system ATPase TssH n=1 Tax=Marinomonas arctica TaxID=383750 RepID=A0A7H1J901_9GAMM|nr:MULTISPECIES: type VI secretion system ATPase TssH [Marinomonas]MCS7488594.1 ATPase AAA [Marinomonas sp. BSi20414]QNT06967.1 type VI secretion system ATPase TssH [Marinomonas arctica]GGN39246.1 ClpV1 family T6SS ATPase [Marinomonas arctica]
MIRIELSTLISKLNSQSKLALEQAAALCIERQHHEVSIEHFLSVLLENPMSDVCVILEHVKLSKDDVQSAISKSYPRSTTLDTYPAFSPLLVELLQEAWLLSSTELNQTELRSGAILLASLIHPDRYYSFEMISLFEKINKEAIRKNFDFVLETSSESDHPVHDSQDKSSQQTATGNSALGKFCTNVTLQAKNDELDPVLCREDELNLMVDILCRRRKNNPIVVGEAGVGKSAVVEGLALRIVAGNVPDKLSNVEIHSLDLGLLQAGASIKGEFEKRLKGIIDEIKSSPVSIILFIDEAHTLIGSGNQEGGSDAANLLKPALARGELSTIAATTWKEYKKYFEKDPALTRRFQLVKVEEPSVSQSVDIMRGLHHVYEKAHGVLIHDDALKASSELSARYLSGRQLPDKAIDVLDTACARIAINISTPPKVLGQLENQCCTRQREIDMLKRQASIGQPVDNDYLESLIDLEAQAETEKEALLRNWSTQKTIVEKIIDLRQSILRNPVNGDEALSADELDELREQLTSSYQELEAIPRNERLMYPEVNAQQIAEVISDWTGVPIDQMNSDELHKITHLPEILSAKIKGQDVAIECVHRHLLTSRADLRRPGRPKGAFLLVGPSGVGKTETVIQLAEELYGGKQFLTTINMSEYQEKHTVSRLIGSPPGYVGFGEGGVLTEAIRKKPYSVVLLDEVEKAHPEVLNLFYQAFDKGELADGEGRLIDCQNILFFLTSNLGYQTIVDNVDTPKEIESKLYPELVPFFKPALLARMEIVPYLPLNKEVLEKIVLGKLSFLENVLHKRYAAEVEIDPTLVQEILNRATRSENGARMLEAIIEGQVLPPISLALLNRLAEQQPVSRIYMTVEDGEFVGEIE